MDEDGYGVTLQVGGVQHVFTAHTYEEAITRLSEMLQTWPSNATVVNQVVCLIDGRIITQDEGSVTEVLAWSTGSAPREQMRICR